MQNRTIGPDKVQVGAMGYGAMVLEGYYGTTDESSAVKVIQHALDVGSNMIDTASAYGGGHNEETIAKAIAGRRDDAYIATKFGIVTEEDESGTEITTGWGNTMTLNGSADYAMRSLERSLKRLNTDVIDLWYLHVPDPSTPVEESVGAIAKAIEQGKVRHLGLSNVNVKMLKAAHAIHPVAAVQYEYSLWQREAEAELTPALKEMGVALVPWAPLGAGFLGGKVDLDKDDFRSAMPRYQGDTHTKNKDRFAVLSDIAAELDVTPAQLALAWLLHQGDQVIPIPGTRNAARIDENAAAVDIKLDSAMLARISEVAPVGSTGKTAIA